MKLYELTLIKDKLSSFGFVSRARRVENNTIEITFDKNDSYFFDMTRGNSTIYKALSKRPLQGFNAPFDTLLHSLLSGSRLVGVEVPNGDKVLRITVAPKSSYKDKLITLQLEFTGRNTNAILLDTNEVIIEALRHIDSDSSYRVVRPGIRLDELPAYTHKEEAQNIEDIDELLSKRHETIQTNRLTTLKEQKLAAIRKKIKKLTATIEKLPDEKRLSEQQKEYQMYGNIILSNLYNIKPYDTKLTTTDFKGDEITIKFPKAVVVNRLSDYFFSLAKRAKNKAQNIHIELDNLQSKRMFYSNILYAIEQAKELYELELLVPKKAKQQKRKERLRDGELFWIDDYKVYVGRNSNENQKLLKLAKSNDIWMHLQGIPSSHVIIRTDKQNLPDSVITAAAKLCVDFSTQKPGDYKVDYTKRKFVKVQDGSNVLYNKYDTVHITKEGVEIRD